MPDPHTDRSNAASPTTRAPESKKPSWLASSLTRLRSFISKKREEEAIIEAVEEIFEADESQAGHNAAERELLTNLLGAREKTIKDVMIPRAEIFAADETVNLTKLAGIMSKSGHSRVPIFRRTLDDSAGFIHIKDVTAAILDDKPVLLKDILRKLLFVPPSMPITKLLLQMRQKRQHMALVIDEFGGVDGLVTIEDVVEVIVGDIDDEHDDPAQLVALQRKADGSVVVDARMPIDTFEEHVGDVLQENERQENDTLGGLVFSLAGRVPARGEILRHPSGISFEVIEGDTRRIKRLRLYNLPKAVNENAAAAPLHG